MSQKEYSNKIIEGDILNVLQKLPDDFVDMGVTSPPYNKGENKKGWLVANVKYSNGTDKIDEKIYQNNESNLEYKCKSFFCK